MDCKTCGKKILRSGKNRARYDVVIELLWMKPIVRYWYCSEECFMKREKNLYPSEHGEEAGQSQLNKAGGSST
jgi:hypothetical protein